MKKIRIFFSHLVENKILLYFILFLFCIISLILFLTFPSNPLTANFLAGSIELIVAVTIVDALLGIAEDKGANSKFIRLNQSTTDGIRITLVIAVIRLGKILNYQYEKDLIMKVQSISNLELISIIKGVTNSSQFRSTLEKCVHIPNLGESLVKKIAKEIESTLDQQTKSLKSIKPYTNPDIELKISDVRVKQTVYLTIIKDMAKIIKKVERKHPGSKKTTTELVWEPLIQGEIHGEEHSLEGIIQSYLNLLVYLHDKAEKRELHYEI